MPWLLKNDPTGYADRILRRLAEQRVMVPGLWFLEIDNVLLVRERRKHIGPAESLRFLRWLRELPINVDDESMENVAERILSLSRDYELSAYDGAYLELAMRRNLSLATLDRKLKGAADKAGVALIS